MSVLDSGHELLRPASAQLWKSGEFHSHSLFPRQRHSVLESLVQRVFETKHHKFYPLHILLSRREARTCPKAAGRTSGFSSLQID